MTLTLTLLSSPSQVRIINNVARVSGYPFPRPSILKDGEVFEAELIVYLTTGDAPLILKMGDFVNFLLEN